MSINREIEERAMVAAMAEDARKKKVLEYFKNCVCKPEGCSTCNDPKNEEILKGLRDTK